MPTPTPEQFWTLVAESGLADRGRLEGLRREFDLDPAARGATPDAVTEAVAKWLVRRGALTVWQARRLVRGDRGPFIIGDYRLLERLESAGFQGAGSKGVLLRARHEPSGRVVCLMLLDASLCRKLDVWTDIVRRTSVAHQAADPTLIRTYALEKSGSQRFIVCEDVPGESLAAELAARGPLPVAEAGPLMLAIARAVAELNRLGVPHAGLSLDSLRREPTAAGGSPHAGRMRLLQFPLVGDPHVAPPRPAIDSPESIRQLETRACFLAPELLLPGARCDARSDVYALGCVFHALLTGGPPCWQGDAERTLAHAAFTGPQPLGPPQVPTELATLIDYMVARDPAARYATAADAADAIAVCLGLPPVSPTLPQQRPLLAPEAVAGTPAAVAVPADAAVPAAPACAAPADPRRRKRKPLLGLGLGLAAACIAAAAVGWFIFLRSADLPQPGDKTPAKQSQPTAVADAAAMPPAEPAAETSAGPTTKTRIVDSSEAPWASPTDGPPPTLEHLPPGSQLVLLARPADMLASDEGRLLVRGLGPRASLALESLAAFCGRAPEEIVELQAGWQSGGPSSPDAVVGGYTVRCAEPLPVAEDPASREKAWGNTKERTFAGETIHSGSPLSFWLPTAADGKTLVVAPEKMLEETIENHRQMAAEAESGKAEAEDWRGRIAANLSPDMEELVGMLDSRRHLTLFGSPNYLVHDGRPILAGPLAKLVEPLGEFFGDTLPAAALSMHCGKNFYLELDCVAEAGTPARKLAGVLADRIDALSQAVEEYCNALDPHPYGRKLVMRLPRMLGIVAGNLRSGSAGRGIVVNCLLPEHAGHNLALAAELAIEQSPDRMPSTAVADGQPAAAGPRSALDALQKKISLVFPSDNLEKSVQMIADEIGVPMEILGRDLELEGITKNQSFSLNERDKTADAILRTILAKSNPDGKLVYVVRKKDGVESVEITTRAAASKRGDKLPPGFEEQPASDPSTKPSGKKTP
jgi:hypothetical protein